MHAKWRSQQGLTLIEVIVALLVTAIGALAVARLIPQSMAVTTKARRQTLALQAAQEKMEEITSLPYDDVIAEGLAPVSTDPHNEHRLIRRRVEVAYVDPPLGWAVVPSDRGMKRVRVTSQWREGVHTRSITLETMVSDR